MANSYQFQEITADEVQRRLDAGEKLTIIDIREPFEWQMGGVIPGARLSPMRQFLLQELGTVPQQEEVVLVCASGVRTADAAIYMGMKGFTNVKSMAGGMKAWHGDRVPPDLTK